MLDSVRRFDGADVFVVVLSSIGDQSIEMFATDLFNYWGVGDDERDDGLLMLMVEDQHKLRFETGYGLEEVLPDVTCMRIFQDIIVPYFKDGRYSEGLYAGTCAVAGSLGYLPDDSEVTMDRIAGLQSSYTESSNDDNSFESGLGWIVLIIYAVISLIFVGYFGGRLFKHAKELDPQGDVETAEKALDKIKEDRTFLLTCCLMCCPALPVALLLLILIPIIKKRYRKAVRICSCGHEMRLLSEDEEDPYMSENQVFEESLGVKDVDVWVCDACGQRKIVQLTTNKARRYYTCPNCHCLAGKNKYDTTVVAATTSHSGQGLHHIVCQKCGHGFTQSYVIPKKSQSSGSSGDGGGHSSGGGSFGGGHSGGGGYTGSW